MIINPAIQVIYSIMHLLDQTEKSDDNVFTVDAQSINFKIQFILKRLIEIPFEQFQKEKPAFMSFNFEKIFRSDSTSLLKVLGSAIDQVAPAMDSSFCCLIAQIILREKYIPDDVRFYIPAKEGKL